MSYICRPLVFSGQVPFQVMSTFLCLCFSYFQGFNCFKNPIVYVSIRHLIKASSVLCLQVAIKSIRKEKIKDEQDMVHIRREIEIMSSLRHPHIISIYEGESPVRSFDLSAHKQKTCMSKTHPSLGSLSTCGRAAGLSCYDMQMS